MPLRALPSGQVVRLVFPTSQVLVTGGRKPVAQAGPARALKGWPASVAALPSSHTLNKCWPRPWGGPRSIPASGVRPGPREMAVGQGSMGTSWGVARAGMRGTGGPPL